MPDPASLPRCPALDGSGLRIVPAYTEAGQFCEANCVTVTDGERTAVYVPVGGHVAPAEVADRQIVLELYRAVVLLGGQSDLLGVIGSWKDSLPNDDVLAGLKAWNAAERDGLRRRIEHYEAACPRPACTPTAETAGLL
jgi:hypothetical protein